MLNVFVPISKKLRAQSIAPPTLLVWPEVLSGAVTKAGAIVTRPGWTLVASPATWDATDGAVVSVSQWWDLTSDTPLAPEGQLALPVTQAMLTGAVLIDWRTVGARGGLVTTVWAEIRAAVVVPWAQPPSFYPAKKAAITGSHLPGATLTKPGIVWVDALSESGVAMTVVGTWYKNGSDTGAHGPTYNDTAQGDTYNDMHGVAYTDALGAAYTNDAQGVCITYKEVATAAGGVSTSDVFSKDVSRFIAHYLSENLSQYASLVAGKPAGAAGMNVFSTSTHATATYVRNVNSWAAPLVSQLTGCVAAKSWAGSNNSGPWNNQYGGVMITPRHVLYCQHAHPHAGGTWGVNYAAGPCRLRFVKADNSIVEVIQLCQNNSFGGSDPSQYTLTQYETNRAQRPWEVVRNPRVVTGWTPAVVGGMTHDAYDLCVGLVDTDVTTLGIPVVPILRQPSGYQSALHAGSNLPTFAISQDGRWGGDAPAPVGNYPRPNSPMTWIGVASDHNPPIAGDSVCTPYKYATWDSDSGTPSFILHRGTVYLDSIITSAATIPSGITAGCDTELSFINWAIGAVDAAAVTMGRLTAPTGLSVAGVLLTD